MSDIRDWGAFLRGRWNWTRGGYEENFPRKCQFTDVDATVEFDGRRLIIEPKHYDGEGPVTSPGGGQLRFLRDEVALGKTVLYLYGRGACDNPFGVYDLGREEWDMFMNDENTAWLPLIERRQRLKFHIDRAMGLTEDQQNYAQAGEGAVDD